MKVTVTDHIDVSSDVTAAQALAYVRRVLRPKDGWQEEWNGNALIYFERRRDSRYVDMPAREDIRDFAWMLARTCEALARAGVVRQPSEALRAMAEEVVPHG